MTDFQVGDRVSVEGVVTERFDHWVQFRTGSGTLMQVMPDDVTLIERPRRKLRVGSVWECSDEEMPTVRYTVIAPDLFVFTHKHGPTFMRRDITSIDSHPQDWREVPVEELAREAHPHCLTFFDGESGESRALKVVRQARKQGWVASDGRQYCPEHSEDADQPARVTRLVVTEGEEVEQIDILGALQRSIDRHRAGQPGQP